ncbi:DUF3515 domain-containing protein [Actinokineospora inagensis]|uniref:DUF3515 domain-containing protein n=1 Tax=Actinokineospora inagensis TaxID=103730 RepID=UPI000429DEBA|nr:DUF3515 domain-containing protein [Actinokineospora inagensis]
MSLPSATAPESRDTGLSRRTVVAAAVLVGLLVVGVVVASRFAPRDLGDQAPVSTAKTARTGPVGLVPVDAPDSGTPSCVALTAALPGSLPNGGKALPRLDLADPAPPATAAWGDQIGDPVVLRCGLGKPPELTPTSELREVSGVRWLVVTGDEGASTWFAVDRPVYVALTLPTGLGTGPLQTVSEVVGRALERQPVRP